VYNGEHDWPGAFGNYDISSNIEIWKFFSRYDINGTLNVKELEDANSFNISPNPVRNTLTVNRVSSEIVPFQVHSMDGKEILSGQLTDMTHGIDIGGLNTGTYIISVQSATQRFVVQ
jgi:polyhydroxybutyrate depolymerase